MASSLIGSLRVALSLGTTEFEAGANKAASVARTKAKEIEGSFNGAKAAVAGLFAAFTVGLLTEQIKKSLDYAGSIAEVSRTLGVTTKDLQTFRYAATQTGVSQDQLEVGLRRLNTSMGKAELGSKAQAKAFAAVMTAASGVKVSVEQADAKIKAMHGNTGEAFRLLADGLSKVTDRAQRNAVEMTLMGRSGATLDNLLAPGSRRLNELAEAAQKLGIVLSDETIRGAEETAHKLEAVKMVLEANIANVVAQNAGAILSLSSALATLTGSIIKFLGSNPQLALGIVGALLGGRVGGLPGAVLGGAAGALLGGKVAQTSADSNMDLGFRTDQMRTAQQRYLEALKPGGYAPAMSVNGMQVAGGAGVSSTVARDEFFRQINLLKEAAAQTRANAMPKPPGVDLPKFLGGGDKKPKKPKKGPEDKTEQDDFEFAQQQRQLDLQILEAKKSLSHDVSDQAEISLQMIGIQSAIKDAEIDHKVEQAKRDFAQKKITASTLAQIETEAKIEKGKEAQLTDLQRKAILDQRDEQLLQQSIQLDQHGYDLRKEMLQKQADLAQTASERRAIELQLLDLAYKEKRIILDRIIAESKDPMAVAQAQQDRAALSANYALDRKSTLQQTQGPLEQYMSGLPTSAAKWQEALQGVAVNGFGALETAIMSTLDGTKKLGKAFGDMAKSIIADLIKISIERSIIGPLAQGLSGAMGGSGGGGAGGSLGGLGGLLGSLFGGGAGGALGGASDALGGASSVVEGASGLGDMFTVASSVPGLATGGSMLLKGNMGVDRNLLSMNGMPIARVGYGEHLNVTPRGGGEGSSGNVTIHAPITINSPVSNNTAGQLARELNVRLAQARTKGF